MRKIKQFVVYLLFLLPRLLKYKFLSNAKNIMGKPKINQATLFLGKGLISFGKNVNLGVIRSPFFYSGYGYIDVRNKDAKIHIDDNVWINNNFTIISEKDIYIGKNCLIGCDFEVIDSDFHDLNPKSRNNGNVKKESVKIDENVFIGNSVKVLKGVTIGKNSVIANGSVITKNVSANSIYGGIPAKYLGSVYDE